MAKTTDSPKTFKVTEDFEAWLAKQVVDLDCSLSELVRTSLLLSVPLIKANPALLKMITLEQFKSVRFE